MGSSKIRTELAYALKNVNLTTATIEDIQKAVSKKSPQIYQEVMDKIPEIERVLKNRDISKKLNYDSCYVSAINKNKNSWKTLSKDITIKGKNGNSLKAN